MHGWFWCPVKGARTRYKECWLLVATSRCRDIKSVRHKTVGNFKGKISRSKTVNCPRALQLRPNVEPPKGIAASPIVNSRGQFTHGLSDRPKSCTAFLVVSLPTAWKIGQMKMKNRFS
jgi:hypothetical protein